MRELSLFTGAGGGLLGTMLLGWEPIGYVEIDEYCQRVIRARIDDGYLPAAPIWTDVREFIESGAAREYRGFADVVTGGFPCQPFSVAGKGEGEHDPRNLWPETRDIIRAVGPRFVLLENVPGLLAHRYGQRILGDLAESGYCVRWRILSAAEMGAPHLRKRLWIVGIHTDANAGRCVEQREQEHGGEQGASGRESYGLREGRWRARQVSYAISDGRQREPDRRMSGRPPQHDLWSTADGARSPRAAWWATEPALGRVADGVADRVGQLRALGNGQVPAVVARAWRELTGE